MRPHVLSALARALAADDPLSAATRTLGRSYRWLPRLVARFHRHFDATMPRHRDVVAFLREDVYRHSYGAKAQVVEWMAEPPRMRPVEAAIAWQLPAIVTTGDLAAWLGLSISELDWFADLRGLNHRSPKLEHYRYKWIEKRSGGRRLTEAPKPRLKQIQRQILHGILDRVPAHQAAHAYVKSRSIVTFAAPHCGQPVVARLDLADFFPNFPAARIEALFRTLGYPEPVAALLGGLCSNRAPAGGVYGNPHLPQGAPTSPALANLMAYRLDCRLAGLARTAGANYTRYADDLAFSGDIHFERFLAHAAAVALEEGFHVNHRKTRIKRQGARQLLAGLVVNHSPSPRRADLERLEATLYNAARRPSPQETRAQLEGRVSFVEMTNPTQGRYLRELFEAINWSGPDGVWYSRER